MNYISVKNFEQYQHYKTRNITSWVKLYFSILDDYDFTVLTDSQKWVYIGLILLSGKTNNKIPLDYNYIKMSLRCTSSDVKTIIDKLLELKFVRQSIDNVKTESFPDKIRLDKIREDKNIYADSITMFKVEYDKLINQIGEVKTKEMIERLNNYKASKGIKYKSDYHTILNWLNRDKEKVTTEKFSNLRIKPEAGKYDKFEPKPAS